LGIIPADTLSLHDITTLGEEPSLVDEVGDYIDAEERLERAWRIKRAPNDQFSFDVAIGNPPYVGEAIGADLWRQTRERYPYWESFVAPHVDYLYPFLVVGISKLRAGGRFAFITTEYWLRAAGAAPLREFIAGRCRVERLLLFRNLRLFPDAPGQHSLVFLGERLGDADGHPAPAQYPRVSIYEGANVRRGERRTILEALRDSRSSAGLGVSSFRAVVSPQELGRQSWAEVVLPRAEVERRRAIRSRPQLGHLDITEGVIPTANRLTAATASQLSEASLTAAGWPHRTGIFSLSSEEVSALGHLNTAEVKALRWVVNTADVLPYAAIVSGDADRMIYLPKPNEDEVRLDIGAVQNQGLPTTSMPALSAHLLPFRSFLLQKVETWGERRPWWTLHRPREEVVDVPHVSN